MMLRRTSCALLLLITGFGTGVLSFAPADGIASGVAKGAFARLAAQTAAPAPGGRATVAAPPGLASAPTLPDFTRVAERTIPAVVNVSSQQVVRRRTDPLLEFLYGDGFGGRAVENSLGSGVIVTRDGYILTNNHVVTGEGRASLRDIEITVALSDKREMPAAVVGVDPGTDLALLKVDGRDLPVMPWGDSDRLRVAEWVLAIGNPYQLSETVTLGIVSAVNRTNVGINDFENFIQTDAAINPGNSGGALVNSAGELVGINTAIFSQSGGYQGIGFAVASNLARKVMADLQEFGEVRRGTIGTMAIIPLTTRLAQQLGADSTRGVVIRDVLRGSSADRAGLQRGDIIVGFNGTDVADGRQLDRLVGETPIGTLARVTVLRAGKTVELRVPIEQRRQQQRR